MRAVRLIGLWAGLVLSAGGPAASSAQDSTLMFAVITEAPTDKSRVTAQVLVGDELLGEATLLAGDHIQQHVMWRKLEMCQSVKAEVEKVRNGYRVLSFKMVGASMLPMQLQGVAGDCMLKKALEYAPLLE